MIITLDLAKTFGTNNADIAKKNKITKIDMTINLQPEESSDDTTQPTCSETIDQTLNNLTSTKVSESQYRDVTYSSNWLGNRISGESDEYTSYYATVYYKTYNLSIDLSNSQYDALRYANSETPTTISFNGRRRKATSPSEYTITSMRNSIIVYDSFFFARWDPPTEHLSYSEIASALSEIDLWSEFSLIDNNNGTLAGVARWDENNSFTNNEFSVTSNEQTTTTNIVSEINSIISDITNTSDDFSDFSGVNDYLTPQITRWNNDGSTLNIDIIIPTKVCLFGSDSVITNFLSDTLPIIAVGEYSLGCTESAVAKEVELYSYTFTQATLTFFTDYTTETEDRTYYDGNYVFTAENSFLFTDGVVNSDTSYSTVTSDAWESGVEGKLYGKFYSEVFADEIYETYQNGKVQLEITYPVGKLQTIAGLDVVYLQQYGLCVNIGDEYFDEDGNKLSINEGESVLDKPQIPEGVLCYIVKNGEPVFTNSDGSAKYFLVQSSNLVYDGILVNELKLIESTETTTSGFDECSWAEINAIGKLGKLDEYFSVGEIKYVDYLITNTIGTTNDYRMPLVILGFNHDYLVDGVRKAGMTVGMLNVLGNTSVGGYPFNEDDSAPLTWEESTFRTTAIPILFSSLPSELQEIIPTVRKTSVANNVFSGQSGVEYSDSEDTLFLLSIAEITGADYIIQNYSSYFGANEGEQYEYFKTVKDGTTNEGRIKNEQRTVGYERFSAPTNWASRSLSSGNSSNLSYLGRINSDGSIETSSINSPNVCFAFCVGDTPFSGTLDDLTWEQINNAASNGFAEEYFSVGDEKTITLSTGEEVTLVILGFNHDDLSDGSGKAVITFGMKDLLTDTYQMNTTNTNSGGWGESYMRTTTLDTIFSQLPSDLQDVIQSVDKKTLGGYSAAEPYGIEVTSDKLWLPSFVETTGTIYTYYNEEGEQYEYYKVDGTLAKRKANGTGNTADWWARTPSPTDRYGFGIVDYNYPNAISFAESVGYWCVSFCFCVGKEKSNTSVEETPESGTQLVWEPMTWNGLSSFTGNNVWTDGNNYYYSSGTNQYVLNADTQTWSTMTWNGPTPEYGRYIWADGSNIYYSSGGNHYVLNVENHLWFSTTWNGFSQHQGEYIWTDGVNIYFSYGTWQYIIDIATQTLSEVTWNGLSSFAGNNVWTDGNNYYYSSGTNQYVLNIATSTWSEMTWYGLTSFYGNSVWTDGNSYYYSSGTTQYVLDVDTQTWSEMTWNGLSSFTGNNVWTDGNSYYYSSGTTQYVLTTQIISNQ